MFFSRTPAVVQIVTGSVRLSVYLPVPTQHHYQPSLLRSKLVLQIQPDGCLLEEREREKEEEEDRYLMKTRC